MCGIFLFYTANRWHILNATAVWTAVAVSLIIIECGCGLVKCGQNTGAVGTGVYWYTKPVNTSSLSTPRPFLVQKV